MAVRIVWRVLVILMILTVSNFAYAAIDQMCDFLGPALQQAAQWVIVMVTALLIWITLSEE